MVHAVIDNCTFKAHTTPPIFEVACWFCIIKKTQHKYFSDNLKQRQSNYQQAADRFWCNATNAVVGRFRSEVFLVTA